MNPNAGLAIFPPLERWNTAITGDAQTVIWLMRSCDATMGNKPQQMCSICFNALDRASVYAQRLEAGRC